MTDVTAGQNAQTSDSDQLSQVFVLYGERVTRFIASRLPKGDWHLAEDLTSEVFVQVLQSYTLKGRPLDERVWGLLATIARRAISQYYRRRSSGELSVDFTDWFEERMLPADASAEDVALANLVVLDMLAEAPAPLGVAA
ncbi:sigma factor [Streptomyces sp. NPDC006638]|uniref:RNA polymerase sigma factor n=1 Tax=Streptomyces sp. NPDC006638 TaxID=3157183 RepID=UPI0033A58B02